MLRRHIENVQSYGRGLSGCICPEPECKREISVQIIRSICGDDVATALEQQTKKLMSIVFECPGCKEVLVVPKGGSLGRNVRCDKCRRIYCRLCMKREHKGMCKNRQKHIQEMRNNELGEVMPCPYCLQLTGKDENCDRVICFYCHEEFYFCCSVKCSPAYVHGPQYHRLGCDNYGENGVKEKMDPKCEECKRLKELCHRPGMLVDGDIPEAEIPSELRD